MIQISLVDCMAVLWQSVLKMSASILAWGDNSVSSCRSYSLTVEPKVLALVQECFLWRVPYLERVQAGVLDGVRRGPVGPPGTP